MGGLSHLAPASPPHRRIGSDPRPGARYGLGVGRGPADGFGVTTGAPDGPGPGDALEAGLAPGELPGDADGAGWRTAVPSVFPSIQKIAGAWPGERGIT
jgi:hypothetical protein